MGGAACDNRPMPGTLYLGCGSAADEVPLWRVMFHRTMTRIVYWPFALPGEMCATAEDWLRSNLDRLGVGYQLHTWQGLADHEPAELDPSQVDLLFVGGGNTFRLLDHVTSHGFVDPVRRFWRRGGDYYGGSAGAVLACDSIEIADGHDPNEPGLRDLTGLRLINGLAVLPHFTDDQLEQAVAWAADRQVELLGLPESIGLRCSHEDATVIGVGSLTRIRDGVVEQFGPGDNFDFTRR